MPQQLSIEHLCQLLNDQIKIFEKENYIIPFFRFLDFDISYCKIEKALPDEDMINLLVFNYKDSNTHEVLVTKERLERILSKFYSDKSLYERTIHAYENKSYPDYSKVAKEIRMLRVKSPLKKSDLFQLECVINHIATNSTIAYTTAYALLQKQRDFTNKTILSQNDQLELIQIIDNGYDSPSYQHMLALIRMSQFDLNSWLEER